MQSDTVILPGLGKTSHAKDKDVLIQTEVHTHVKRLLLLSPLPKHSNDKQQDKTYNLIRDFEKQRDALEVARLLYVACTRAESTLYLFGHLEGKEETGFSPASSSLLALLWQDDETCFGANIHIHDVSAEPAHHASGKSAQDQHLPISFQAPTPQSSIPPSGQEQSLTTTAHQPEFSWAGASAKAVGIALHAALQHLAQVDDEQSHDDIRQQLMPMMQGILIKEGIGQDHLAQAMQRCQKALNITLNSSKARWILSQTHRDRHNEWALNYIKNKRCKHIVLDRSFIEHDGVRWVIDYKTGGHEGTGLDAFLDQELIRYTQDTPQLPNYVKALQALEPERTIKAALYFPMVDGWRVWQE